MAKPFREGAGWAVRVYVKGQRDYLSGYKSYADAKQAHDTRVSELKGGDKPARLGSQQTSVAQALSDYALEALPHHKGARQEVRRINRYLRAIGLPVLHLEPHKSNAPVKEAMRKRNAAVERQVHWNVSTIGEDGRAIPASLRKHRAALNAEGARGDAVRKLLAQTMVEDVTRYQVQTFVSTMESEGFGMSTVRLEVAILRQLFGHAKNMWNWARPVQNPASGVKIQKQNNSRDRVVTEEEWSKMAPALAASENKFVFPLVCLMLESAMRSCEPLLLLRWEHDVRGAGSFYFRAVLIRVQGHVGRSLGWIRSVQEGSQSAEPRSVPGRRHARLRKQRRHSYQLHRDSKGAPDASRQCRA
ncbi:hypothetical protein ABIC33_006489 [Variovorax sp. 1140]|uniref:hypothetical protein n=1 Tax=Variovorax atrisoli TaxID=3394203 RepID=UPI003393C197